MSQKPPKVSKKKRLSRKLFEESGRAGGLKATADLTPEQRAEVARRLAEGRKKKQEPKL